MRSILHLGLAVLSLACALSACTPKPVTPPSPPVGETVGIVAVTQPTSTVELMAGYIPDARTLASHGELIRFDDDLALALRDHATTQRRFVALPSEDPGTALERNARHGAALWHWIQVGEKAGADLLVVPQILDWKDREGNPAGVRKSAEIFIQFFLVDVKARTILRRSFMHEKQQSLTGNLLDMPRFFRRGARWLTANELAAEGMRTMIGEFGL